MKHEFSTSIDGFVGCPPEVEEKLNELRAALSKCGWAWGALFAANRTGDAVLWFAKGAPIPYRLSMLHELRHVVEITEAHYKKVH